MRHIRVDKIPPEWISGKSPGLRRIKRASTTAEWRGHIPNGLSDIVGHYSEGGEQTVTLNCSYTSQIQNCQTSVKLRTFASMLLLTQASVITRANKKKQQFRTWSLGKSLQKFFQQVIFFFHSLSSFSTHEGNMGGTRYITQKALHGMSVQRTVSIQEAVHMVDNQDLLIWAHASWQEWCH